MASLMYDSAHFNHTIDKVAKWMATSDSQVCLFADDTSVSILSSTTPSTNSVGEQGRQVLIDRLKCDAVSRIRSLLRSTANQENNHNESKKKSSGGQRRQSADSRSSSEESPNRNRNNRHGGSESERRHKSHSDSRRRRQSQPSNSHSTAQRKDSGDGSAGGGGGGGSGGSGFKDDKYLERIIERASQEIRSAIYKLKAENKLPESCHLKMKLSIKPQRTSGAASSPKESPAEHKRHQAPADDRRRSKKDSGRHRTSERDMGGGRSDRDMGGRPERDKRATSSSNRHEHHEMKREGKKKAPAY